MSAEEIKIELELLKGGAEAIHKRLTVLDVRSGAVGAARTLIKKLDATIEFFEKNGGTNFDERERLAANAWRVAQTAASEDGELVSLNRWLDLTEDEKAPWRKAAHAFRDGQGKHAQRFVEEGS